MNERTHTCTRTALRSTITQEYFDRKFPNTPGDWPPPCWKNTHSHTHVSVGQMKLPFKVTAQSTAAQFWPRTLHSFQIVSWWSHCSLCYVRLCVWVCGREKKCPFAGDISGICVPLHGAVIRVTFHLHPANTVALPFDTLKHTHFFFFLNFVGSWNRKEKTEHT